MIHESLFEDIGHNTIRCVASTRQNMVGIMEINPTLNKPWVIPVEDKDEALYWLRQNAYYDNLPVYTIDT